MWNTFEALGIKSTNQGITIRSSKLGGRKSHVYRKHGLDPRNIGHRVKVNDYEIGLNRRHFEDVRMLSLKLDRMHDAHPALSRMLDRYWIMVKVLKQDCITLYHKLVRLERARGVKRAELVG